MTKLAFYFLMKKYKIIYCSTKTLVFIDFVVYEYVNDLLMFWKHCGITIC